MLWWFLFLIAPSLPLDFLDCPNINETLNTTTTWSIGPVQLAPGKDCVFALSYSNVTFARITLTLSNVELTDEIEIFNAYGGNPIRVNTGERAFVFNVSIPPPLLQIHIKTAANSTMSMNLTVFGASFRGDSRIVTANAYEGYWYFTSFSSFFYYQLMSFTKQLAIFIAMPDDPTNKYLLSNAFVYDGYQNDAQLLGTLYDYLDEGYIYSQSTTIRIYCANSLVPLDGVLMYTDKSNVDYFHSYNVIWAQKTTDLFQSFTLDASSGMAAVTIVNEPSGAGNIYLTEMALSIPNSLQVDSYNYAPLANISSMVKLASYANPNLNLHLPQHFDGSSRTFVLKTGTSNLKWTADANKTTDSVATIGRSGFIATPNYPIRSSQTSSQGITLHSANGQNYSLEVMVYDGSDDSKVIVDILSPSFQSFTIPVTYQTLMVPLSFVGSDFHVSIAGSTSDSGTILYYSISADTSGPASPTNLPTAKPSSQTTRSPQMPTTPRATSNYSIIPSFISLLAILLEQK